MPLICFSSINFFPSILHPINQICCSACNSLWRRGLWLYEVNAAEPFNLHRLKFYVCCSFLLFSSAKNYLSYKTKTQVHFFPHSSIYLAIRFQVPFPKFSWEKWKLWIAGIWVPGGRGALHACGAVSFCVRPWGSGETPEELLRHKCLHPCSWALGAAWSPALWPKASAPPWLLCGQPVDAFYSRNGVSFRFETDYINFSLSPTNSQRRWSSSKKRW